MFLDDKCSSKWFNLSCLIGFSIQALGVPFVNFNSRDNDHLKYESSKTIYFNLEDFDIVICFYTIIGLRSTWKFKKENGKNSILVTIVTGSMSDSNKNQNEFITFAPSALNAVWFESVSLETRYSSAPVHNNTFQCNCVLNCGMRLVYCV